jgi:folate-binding protein YgfZ
MRIYHLNKVVLKAAPRAERFLNGLTSNAMDQPRSAFLNVNGRIVATFDQHRIDEDQVLLVVEAAFVDGVLLHLERYARLSGVKVERLAGTRVYFDLDNDYQLSEDEYRIPQKKGQLILSRRCLTSTVAEEEFTLFRLSHSIPLLGVDYQKDEFLLNVSEQDFVSYVKGCFLGQEPIAKVYHRCKPTWRLIVRTAGEETREARGEMTSRFVDEAGSVKGFVFVRNP